MVWFKVDDSLAFHRKAIAAGNSAMGLWVRAGSWSAQQLTDGYVPDHVVDVLGTTAQARRLVRAGLWTEADGGYCFHQWTDNERNPSRHDVLLRRKRDAERQHERREKKKANPEESQDNGGSPPVTHSGVTGGVTGGVQMPRPDPSPVSTDVDTGEPPSGVPRTRARATRLPDDFAITDDMRRWAASKTPGVDVDYETDKFCDYWRGVSGQRGTKRDWAGTWRNWMRKASENSDRRRSPQTRDSGLSTADQRVMEAQRLKHNPPSHDGFGQLRVIEA